ncbi:FMN-binding protein [Eubacterium sp.]
MHNIRNIKIIGNFIPTIIVFALVVASLNNYQPKTFEAKVKEEIITKETQEDITEEIIETDSNKDFTEKSEKESITDNIQNKQTANLNAILNKNENKNATYKDGEFYGTAQGFRGEIKVSVVIKNGKIQSVKCISSQDDKAYFDKASNLMKKIVDKQSASVDVVSGATYSSNGIIGAVKNALSKAVVSESTKEETTKTAKKKNVKKSSTKKSKKGKFPYKNGVYYGTGEGYKGETKVAVVIENKKIQYILILENEDDKAYFNRAKSVATQVVKNQKTKVDTVSGATYSSNGILEAIKNALKEAKKKTSNKNNNNNKSNEDNNTNSSNEETVETTTKQPSTDQTLENGTKVYKDGTYTVTGICSPNGHGGFEAYTLSATVTIINDKIIAVSDVKGVGSDYDKANDWYIKRAVNGTSKYQGVVKQIVAKGNAESIDTVSGATCSSEALIEIVKQALEGAKNN